MGSRGGQRGGKPPTAKAVDGGLPDMTGRFTGQKRGHQVARLDRDIQLPRAWRLGRQGGRERDRMYEFIDIPPPRLVTSRCRLGLATAAALNGKSSLAGQLRHGPQGADRVPRIDYGKRSQHGGGLDIIIPPRRRDGTRTPSVLRGFDFPVRELMAGNDNGQASSSTRTKRREKDGRSNSVKRAIVKAMAVDDKLTRRTGSTPASSWRSCHATPRPTRIRNRWRRNRRTTRGLSKVQASRLRAAELAFSRALQHGVVKSSWQRESRRPWRDRSRR